MLPRHAHLVSQMGERERGCPALKAALAILPGDTVKDDRCEFVACGRKVRFSDATQNGAGGQVHERIVLFAGRLAIGHEKSFGQNTLPVERVLQSR